MTPSEPQIAIFGHRYQKPLQLLETVKAKIAGIVHLQGTFIATLGQRWAYPIKSPKKDSVNPKSPTFQ